MNRGFKMKNIIIFLMVVIFPFNIFANQSLFDKYFNGKTACIIIYDINQNKLIEKYNPKRCDQRITSASTFKVPLALMAFDQGIFNQNTSFKWDGKDKGLSIWNQDQTPKSWFDNSAVWVSQLITPKLGLEKIKGYLREFHYGNQDFSGDPGLNNGLTNAWLSSSLKISANEQFEFLKALVNDQLPVSKAAMHNTKENMYIETTPNGWQLYGKTGTGRFQQQQIKMNDKTKLQHGWFIGFITKANQKYIFVLNFTDLKTPQDKEGGGARAKLMIKQILNQMELF